jgi:hypothetical protein
MSLLVAAACSGSTTVANTTIRHSVAEQVYAHDGSATVEQYQQAFRALGARCRERVGRLADFAVKAQRIIRNRTHRREPLIRIIRRVTASIPTLGKTLCVAVFDAYTTLKAGP